MFAVLPVELREEILAFLPAKDLGGAAPLVCKEWERLASSDKVWNRCFASMFSGINPEPLQG